ncbi:MAG: class I SAM-dependent methyltransferase [Oscillospiraceae bacterium]|nr:class I SAM-dependent methyltransferase [Oscillospiraceae bacterium]
MQNQTIQENLATSLTAETTELLPFLPYLLQDFWELGSDPDAMTQLVKNHIPLSPKIKVLDLACGKGAVSVKIAQQLGVQVKGIDLLPEFIEVAKQKATEHNVSDLCEFIVGDVTQSIKTEKDYDVVIFGAAGIVLGSPPEMLCSLKTVIKPGGFILIDEGYRPDDVGQSDVKCNSYQFLTERQWLALFKETGLELIETASDENNQTSASGDSKAGMAFITARANELIEKHPDKRAIFEEYVQGQQDEYDDIENTIACVTWILRKL